MLRHEGLDVDTEALARNVLDAARTVRRELGAGLLEEAYHAAMAEELAQRGLSFQSEVRVPIIYRGKPLHKTYKVDLIVGEQIVLEFKALQELHPIHHAQVLTYMRLAKCPLGFLINFNAVPFGKGVRRHIMSTPEQLS